MSLNSRFSHRAVSRVLVRPSDEAFNRRHILLIASAASALVLCSFGLAKAETWVTVNPDGSVTRTETTASAAMPAQNRQNDQYPDEYSGDYPDDYEVQSARPVVSGRTTTLFSGTYYPLPPVYHGYPQPNYHIQPPGYTYPVGPIFPRVPSPTITNGPGISCGPTYVLPYGYYAPQPQYPYPVYVTPSYGMNGTYYSGPSGGGGTIYSSSTSQNSGTGLVLGNNGLNIQIGGGRQSTQSTTTVTTY